MPTNYSLPNQGQYTFTDYIGINSADPNTSRRHIFPSILQNGGFQEMPETVDMHEIPVEITGAGFGIPKITMDGFGSGRRRIGMLVHVLAEQKIYKLIPQGFYGNGGNNGLSEWNALTDTQKYELLSPTATYNASYTPPNNYTESTPTGAAGDCWVELEFGSDGNPVTDLSYSSGDLTITLTHDGSGSGAALTFTETIPIGYDGIYDPVVADATVVPTDVGGIDGGTTAGALAGLSMNQMWDKLLFPTVNPTGSGASVTLNDSYNLIEPQTTVNMVLTTSANVGTLSNPAGPWAGPVNAAVIDDIGVGNMAQQVLSVGPNPTDIADLTIAYITQLGINKFRLTGSFDQGPMPLDSTGADYPGVRFNAQDKTNTTQFEGVWPIYIGTTQDLGGNNYDFEKRGLVSQSQNNITCVQNYGENAANNLWHRIAVPQAMVTGGDITIQLDAGPLGYQPSYPGGWVKTSTTFDVHNDAQNVPYFLYTKGVPQGGQATWIVNW